MVLQGFLEVAGLDPWPIDAAWSWLVLLVPPPARWTQGVDPAGVLTRLSPAQKRGKWMVYGGFHQWGHPKIDGLWFKKNENG